MANIELTDTNALYVRNRIEGEFRRRNIPFTSEMVDVATKHMINTIVAAYLFTNVPENEVHAMLGVRKALNEF